MVDYVVECWLLLWTSFALIGEPKVAEMTKDLAATSYKIIVGEDETFEKTYGTKAKSWLARGCIWNGL
jgi:hypothetical protein